MMVHVSGLEIECSVWADREIREYDLHIESIAVCDEEEVADLFERLKIDRWKARGLEGALLGQQGELARVYDWARDDEDVFAAAYDAYQGEDGNPHDDSDYMGDE